MILGIIGKARHGKDTFANYLVDIFSSEYGIEFKTTAFAHRLKQMCLEHFNLTRDQLWGNAKEDPTKYKKQGPPQGAAVRYDDGRGLPPWYWTPREIMQEIGSFYRKIDSDFWVRKVDEDWKYNNCPDLVITDVRHKNESDFVKNKGGILIKIVRKDLIEIHGMDHVSEVALDDMPDDYFDIIINNDGSLEDLQISAFQTADVIIKIDKLKNEGVKV